MRLEILSKKPIAPSPKPPLLFVHGAWHGAWCWDAHFLDFFANHGYPSYALSLRGHGGSEGREGLRKARIADYADDLTQAVRQCSSPPVVIGHSMGGFVLQKFLEDNSIPAAVLMASVPPRGVLRTTLRLAARHPAVFLRVNVGRSLYPFVETSALARESLFSESAPEAEVERYSRLLQDESYPAFLDMLVFDLPKPGKVTTPILVLGGAGDRLFSPGEVEATARAYGAEAFVLPDIAHDMMLEREWEVPATKILSWLTGRGL